MELKAYVAILLRRWWIVAIVVIAVVIAAFFIGGKIPPVYQADTSLRVLTPTGGTLSNIVYADNYAKRLMNTYAQLASSDAVIEELKQQLSLESSPDYTVAIVPDSEIIKITARASNPKLAASTANTLAEIIVSKNQTISPADSQDLSILTDRLASVEKELAQAKADYDQLIDPFSQVTAEIAVLDRTIQLKEQTYQSLDEKYQQAVIDESLETNAQLKNAKTKTKEVITQEMSQLETDLDNLKARYEQLSTQSASLTERLSAAREAITLKENYHTDLLNQYDTARMGEAMRTDPHSLVMINPAIPPVSPSNLSRTKIAALGGLVGMLLGVLLAFFVDLFDTRMYSVEKIEAVTGNKILANIPVLRGPQMKPQTEVDIEVQKAFWPLCAQIVLNKQDPPLKTIMITSPDPKEGKSTTTALLAISLTQARKKVLVVDADMRVPKQYKLFDLSNEIGLSDVLNGDVPFEQAVYRDVKPGVDVLTSGPTPLNLVDLIQPSILAPAMKKFASLYDIVLVDSPCMLAVTDASSLSQNVGGVIMAVRQGHTSEVAVKAALRLLANANATVLGVITTWSPIDRRHSYYRYYSQSSEWTKVNRYVVQLLTRIGIYLRAAFQRLLSRKSKRAAAIKQTSVPEIHEVSEVPVLAQISPGSPIPAVIDPAPNEEKNQQAERPT